MASTAAVPFWRSAGMTYITYSNICASLVRKCLKEPHKTEAISREKVHFSVAKWAEGKPQKPSVCGIGQHNKLQVPDPFHATKRQHRYHTVKSSKKQETKYLRALRADTPEE